MRRRALLAALAGTGLAGCSLVGDDRETVTPAPIPPTGTPRPTRDPTAGDGVDAGEVGPDGPTSIVELSAVGKTVTLFPTRFRTEDGGVVGLWLARPATDERPTVVRGFLHNDTDTERTFPFGEIPGPGRSHSQPPDGYGEAARLHLAPTGDNDLPMADVPEVSLRDDGHWYVEPVADWAPATVTLPAGEWLGLRYYLVGEPDAPGRPTGRYDFGGDDHPLRAAVWNTARPGPTEPSRFEGVTVPDLPEDRAVQWYHDADERTRAYVRPGAERVALDATVTFQLHNHSRERLSCGHWGLYKLVDGDWYQVTSLLQTNQCRHLVPGGRLPWQLRAFNGAPATCENDCAFGLTRGHLGGGTYGVVAGYGLQAANSGALVVLEGDPVRIVPTADAVVDRDGAEVLVRTDRFGDGEDSPDAGLLLTRADGAEERLIPEQVMSPAGGLGTSRAHRNTLSVMEPGVERVRLLTNEAVAEGAVGNLENTHRFGVRGRAYELTWYASE